MRRPPFAITPVLLGLAVAMPVSADAPTDQYEPFTAADKEITDAFTHLVWERPSRPYPRALSFIEAKASCPAGTRLPSLKELLSLVDEDPHYEYEVDRNVLKYIDQSAFPNTPAEEFWTSSPASSTKMFTVSFGDGTTGVALLTDARRVRCVRVQ